MIYEIIQHRRYGAMYNLNGDPMSKGFYGNLHYSNPSSNGTVIGQTSGFPTQYDDQEFEYRSAYTDRLRGWDSDHFEALIKFMGTGDQGWSIKITSMSDDRLREFVKLALKLRQLPEHVRIVYWFNVSSGYDCPSLECLTTEKSMGWITMLAQQNNVNVFDEEDLMKFVKVIDGHLAFYLTEEKWNKYKEAFILNDALSLDIRYNASDFVVDTTRNMLVAHPLSDKKIVLETLFDNAIIGVDSDTFKRKVIDLRR